MSTRVSPTRAIQHRDRVDPVGDSGWIRSASECIQLAVCPRTGRNSLPFRVRICTDHCTTIMMALLRPARRGRRSCLRPDDPPGGQLCVPTRCVLNWCFSAPRSPSASCRPVQLPYAGILYTRYTIHQYTDSPPAGMITKLSLKNSNGAKSQYAT